MMYVFEDCIFDPQHYTLSRNGQDIRLQPKAFAVLSYLLQHRERVVTRQELCEYLWPHQQVGEAALINAIRTVRRLLGDTGRAQRFIQTLQGRGYRFVAEVSEQPATEVVEEVPQTPQPAAPPAPAPTPPRERVPHAEALHATTKTHTLGERKPVTLLSCSLVSHTAGLPADLSPTKLAHCMQVLYALAQEVVGSYGGLVQPPCATRLLAVFGAPKTQEDHAQRAALAALRLQRRWQEDNTPHMSLQTAGILLRVGLHTDFVAFETSVPLDEVVTGDAEASAVALQAEAPPGGIICSADTARLLLGLVRLQAVPAVSLPTDHSKVYQVHEERQARPFLARRSPGGLSPFVGRAQELAQLHELLQQVETRRGRVVGFVGEPGVGKSRLLFEFQQQVRAQRGAMFLIGRGVSYGQMIPYLPVLNMLRHACRITAVDEPSTVIAKVHRQLRTLDIPVEPYATLLLTLLGLPEVRLAGMSPEALKAQTLAALVQMCLHSSRQRPLVLLLDDLHWLDPASEDCLTALLERIAGTAVLVVGTYRPGYQPPWLDKSYATQIALPRLNRHDSRALIQTRLQSWQVAEAVMEQILSRADGNAFFLEELTRIVAAPPENVATLGIPETIEAVLMARMDRLLPEDKYLLQLAAVAGKDISKALIEVLTDWPERQLRVSLGHLQSAEFLRETAIWPERLYTFQHGLTQEVAYHSILEPIRQQHHRHVAQALASHFPDLVKQQPALLAQHYSAAELPHEALPYWCQAGEHALARSAYVEAHSHLRHGLEALATLPDTLQRVAQELPLQIALGRVSMATQGYGAAEARQAYARARVLCQTMSNSPRLFPVLRGLATFYYMRAEYDTAYDLGTQCLALAEQTHDTALLLRAHLTLGQIHLFRGEYAEAHEHLGYGCALQEDQTAGALVVRARQDPLVTCYALDATALWFLGLPDQARQCREMAIALARELGHPFSLTEALVFSAIVSLCVREYAAVRAYTDEALSLATTQGFPHWEAHAALYQGWTKVMQGQGREGMAQIQHGQAIWQGIGSTLACPWFLTLQAEAYGHLGEYAHARTTLTKALKLLEETGERHYESEMYRLFGMFLLQDPAENSAPSFFKEVEKHLQHALQIARRQQARSLELRALMSLCDLWRRQGKDSQARRLLEACYTTIPEGRSTTDLRMAAALLRSLGGG